MIEVRHLIKSYGRIRAVDDISFRISAGEVVGFLGPNGAGKSTTMKMLTGYLGCDGGEIEIDSRPLRADPERAKALIGYLPENTPLYEDMTVREYLDFIAEMRGMRPAERREQIDRNLDVYGLRDRIDQTIGELSKGYRQRVGLAQASLNDPPIMILDEPTAGLDPKQIIEIRNLIKELGKTKTVILSTHNLNEVEATSSRILIIHRGKIVADDTPESLEEKNKRAVLSLAIKAEDPQMPGRLAALPGVQQVREEPADGVWRQFRLSVEKANGDQVVGERLFDAAVSYGWKLAELHTERITLEEVFTKLTKD